jgi:SCY1-like protein 1
VIDGRDGWDNDEWGSLEEEPANEELEEKENENHLTASRSNSNSQSHSSSAISNNNGAVNNISPTKQQNNGSGGVDTLIDSSSNSNSNWDNCGSAWNDDEFEPIDEPGTGKKLCNFYAKQKKTIFI